MQNIRLHCTSVKNGASACTHIEKSASMNWYCLVKNMNVKVNNTPTTKEMLNI